MPTYMMIMTLTEQGRRDIKDAPKRLQTGIKQFENMGGKMRGFWASLGEVNYVAVGDIDSDERATSFAMILNSLGNVHAKVQRCYNPEEFGELVKHLF